MPVNEAAAAALLNPEVFREQVRGKKRQSSKHVDCGHLVASLGASSMWRAGMRSARRIEGAS